MVHLIDKYVNILTLEAEKKTGDEDEEQEDDELEIPKTLGDLVKALLRLQRNIRREVKEGIRPFETLATHGVGAVLAGISDVAENRPQTNQTTPRRHSSHHHHHHHQQQETKNGAGGGARSNKKRAYPEIKNEEEFIEVAVKEEEEEAEEEEEIKREETVHHDSVFASAAKKLKWLEPV